MLRILQGNRELSSFYFRPDRFSSQVCAILQKQITYPQTWLMGLVEAMGINNVMGQRSE
jgi:hypothetical protein